jgi:hypothetical protein
MAKIYQNRSNPLTRNGTKILSVLCCFIVIPKFPRPVDIIEFCRPHPRHQRFRLLIFVLATEVFNRVSPSSPVPFWNGTQKLAFQDKAFAASY